MDTKSILNQLELAYSPLSNFDFTALKKDIDIQKLIERSSLYIIAQRPELRFDNIMHDEEARCVSFDIVQNGNDDVLNCVLPIFQENIATDESKEVFMYMGSNDLSNDFSRRSIMNIQSIKFYESEVSDENF
ncbi:hypothetical protein KLP40_16730 [Hymenobacter sp. NST-14]|uniref:hypothetical protein n=1 Tax=Hymenobacter piscis TaxID=2839984 RepID=UPI001C030CC6|nr:hypothetical protein [Hymenobacter piscis]MBT9394814.1 hypothetical protein [Hymenobacter piscis]